jgi:phosphate transport system protein
LSETGPVVRVTLQQDLDRLEAELQEEGTLVQRALRGAVGALVDQDTELADELIAFDDESTSVPRDRGGHPGAARAPDAGRDDLRLVLAVLHVNLHLERAADYCVTIAKLVKLARTSGAPDARRGLPGMGAAGGGDDRDRDGRAGDRDLAPPSPSSTSTS